MATIDDKDRPGVQDSSDPGLKRAILRLAFIVLLLIIAVVLTLSGYTLAAVIELLAAVGVVAAEILRRSGV